VTALFTTKPAQRGLVSLPPCFHVEADGSIRFKPNRADRGTLKSFRVKDANDAVILDTARAAEIAWKWHNDRKAQLPVAAFAMKASDRSFDRLVAIYEERVGYAHLSKSYARDLKRCFKILCRREILGGMPVTPEAMDREKLLNLFVKLQGEEFFGVHDGFKLFTAARLVLFYAVQDMSPPWLPANPLQMTRSKRKEKITQPPGRVVDLRNVEIFKLVKLADWLGLPSLGDFVILALCTGQSVSDVIALKPLHRRRIEVEGGAFYPHQRLKTDVWAFCPETPLLTKRLADIERRQKALWPGREFDFQIIYERTGKPYPYDTLQDLLYALKLLLGGRLDQYNARPQTDCVGPDAHRAIDRTPVLPKIKSLEDLPFSIEPSVMGDADVIDELGEVQRREIKTMDLRDTGLSHYINASDEMTGTLIAGHASGKLVDTKKFNRILRLHYWKQNGTQVVKAAHALDEIHALFHPKPKLTVVA
jgi:hypothetical protein